MPTLVFTSRYTSYILGNSKIDCGQKKMTGNGFAIFRYAMTIFVQKLTLMININTKGFL